MSSIDKIQENLNAEQLKAVTATEGFVRVIAGAGSGKTKALTSRYAYIIEGLGISSSNILCVTFTNKAAQEMKNRVKKLIGQNLDLSYITTYHGFCVRVLREDINKIQYPKSFIIMDVEDQKTILRQVYSELNLSLKEITFKQVLRHIGQRKSSLNYLEFIHENKKDEAQNDLDKIFYAYLFKQQKNFALDFDDLINFTIYIFDKHKDILKKWQQRLHYIQVDEAQDSSDKQFGLIKQLAEHHKNLFLVGDPDQTIYEWRGARPEILVDFDKQFPDCQTIIMNQNYRSTPEILNIANQIIKKNKIRVDKDLFTKNSTGLDVIHFHAKNEVEESEWVVNEIKEIREKGKTKLSDIAILYRAHHVSRNIEQSLIKENIPYTVYGGIRFFERKEIKDVLAYLRLIAIGDDMSFLRIINYPKRGLGKKYIEQLIKNPATSNQTLFKTLIDNIDDKSFNKKGAKDFIELIDSFKTKLKTTIVSDFVKHLLDKTGISKELKTDGDENRLENIQELVNSIIYLEKDNDERLELIDYLQEIALYTNKDVIEEDDGRVNLMTIHTSKGLEYPYVFLCGFSDGILPSAMSIKERRKRAIEEERRLTYVAITRAKKSFYMTEAEGFNYSTSEQKYPSRFLFEIKENMYVQKGEINKLYFREAKHHIAYENTKLEETTIFSVGDLVKHPVWNIGKIINVNSDKGEYQIEFLETKKIKPINFEFKGLEKVENLNRKRKRKTKENTENKSEIIEEQKAPEKVVAKQETPAELIDKRIKAKIKRFAKKEYPEDKEMRDYVYENQVEAYLYMESVSDNELKEFAISEYKNDYEMQKHIYDNNVVAKKYMTTVTDAEIKLIAKEDYTKDYEMQQHVYDQQVSAKKEMAKIPNSLAKRNAINEYPKDYEMQLHIYGEADSEIDTIIEETEDGVKNEIQEIVDLKQISKTDDVLNTDRTIENDVIKSEIKTKEDRELIDTNIENESIKKDVENEDNTIENKEVLSPTMYKNNGGNTGNQKDNASNGLWSKLKKLWS